MREVGGVKVVTRKLDGVDAGALREIADRLRQKYGSAVVALGSALGDGKVALLVAVTRDLTGRIKAGDIVKQIAPIIGGTGGGRPDFAQAGGRDAAGLDEALERIARPRRRASSAVIRNAGLISTPVNRVGENRYPYRSRCDRHNGVARRYQSEVNGSHFTAIH